MVTRLWKGQKEMVTEPYFCGQVWNVERQLWDTVTKEYASEKDADIALNEYLVTHNNKLKRTPGYSLTGEKGRP